MKILDDLLSTLDFEAGVRDVRVGLFHTAVLTRYCGVAATVSAGATCETGPAAPPAGIGVGSSARELTGLAYSARPLEASVGLAAINSLLEIDERRCTQTNGRDILLRRGKGKRVAIIGHFPFVDRIRQEAAELWVVERRPREGDFDESEAARLVPMADVVGITGTTLTNHTIEGLLALCRRDAYVMVLGPTAPLSPVLFRYGVSAISGVKVDDAAAVLRAISLGATFRQLTGIRFLTMENDG